MIEFAILGQLVRRSLSGYDLKKIMMASSYLYWSGNNNQIYKALLQLSKLGYVTVETIHQDGLPSKKRYTATDMGLAALRDWLSRSEAVLPDCRKPFLVQLACAAQAAPDQLPRLLEQYRLDLEGQRAMAQEKRRRLKEEVSQSPLERWLERQISDNAEQSLETEIRWVQQAIKEFGHLAGMEEQT